MRSVRMTIEAPFLAILQSGCSSMDVASSEAEVAALNKIRSGQHELIKSDELAQLRKDAEVGRSVGRYQMHQIGFRTWRLATATGNSCLLLTLDSDWKKPDVAVQACRQ